MSDFILKAENIGKSFNYEKQNINILNNLDLKVLKSEITSILGVSGSGKSTLLYILSGLLKPDKGTVFLEEENLYKLSSSNRAKVIMAKIGFVFQDYQLLADLTVLENVCLPLFLQRGIPKKVVLEKANNLLVSFGLEHRKNYYPIKLSGGEQQRVAIIRALIKEPKIIFCDEPTGSLDKQNAKYLIDLFLELKNKFLQSFVIVSHDQKISEIADNVYNLANGKLILKT